VEWVHDINTLSDDEFCLIDFRIGWGEPKIQDLQFVSVLGSFPLIQQKRVKAKKAIREFLPNRRTRDIRAQLEKKELLPSLLPPCQVASCSSLLLTSLEARVAQAPLFLEVWEGSSCSSLLIFINLEA